MTYSGKTVLVTGAANGIGKGIAAAYGAAGAHVLMLDKDEQAGIALQTAYKEKGYQTTFYPFDLQDAHGIQPLLHKLQNTHGTIHILINNAGLSYFTPFLDLTIEEWDEVLHVNLRAMMFLTQAFVKQHNGSYGRVIHIASTRAFMSESGSEAYAASKGGIVALTHAMAVSLSTKPITVNCISPGWIENGDYTALREIDHTQHPSRRVGQPADIARACLFLSEEANDFINGENLMIDGGMTKKMIYEQ